MAYKIKKHYRPSRKRYRLPCYDYSSEGYYFVTISTYNKYEYFGKIRNKSMIFNSMGIAAKNCWLSIPHHFPNVILDEFVIMPNHVHGIIVIKPPAGTQNFASLRGCAKNKFGPQSKNLGSMVRGFKIGVTKYARQNNIPFKWQYRFYERIIRSENALHNIRQYIKNNPYNWGLDRNHK